MANPLPKVPIDQRATWALLHILETHGGKCERQFNGMPGWCHRDDRLPDAQYGDERWCVVCTAYFGLYGSFPQTIECKAVA